METKQKRILAVNPGSTSTKVAVYDGLQLVKEFTLRHNVEELKGFANVIEQFAFRKDIVIGVLREADIDIDSIDAVIGRGGVVKPIPSGVYQVNDALVADLTSCKYGEHASNLGGLIAREIAAEIGADVPAFIADPVVVDELQDVARISGLPQVPRISIFHALNQKAIARVYAERQGVKYELLDLIVVHLGGGISVGAHHNGRVVDVNNALQGEGPFTPERSGTLTSNQLVTMCLSGEYTEAQLRRMVTGAGGVVAHLGTNDMREVSRMVESGDAKAKLVLDAMCYGIAKEIGAMATVLKGKVDAILLTGGIAHDEYVCRYIEDMVGFIAEVVVIPGENELEALAANALRVLEGEEELKTYV